MDIKRDWDGIQKDIILLRVFDIELQDELQMNNSHLKFTLQPPSCSTVRHKTQYELMQQYATGRLERGHEWP